MNYFFRSLLLLSCAVLVVFIGCKRMPPPAARKVATYPVAIEDEPTVRVLALSQKQPIELEVDGAYRLTVTYPDGTTSVGGDSAPQTITCRATKSGIEIGRDAYKEAEIEPLGHSRVLLRWTQGGVKREVSVRWPLRLKRSNAGNLWAIAAVPMEQYLVGVLPNEMPLSWPPEAVKAQAVASRTFALYHTMVRKKKDWDVQASVMSQVWKPTERADPRALMAVNATSGIVMTENFRVFPAYFHSSAGGPATANARFVFGSSDITALGGVADPHGARDARKWAFTITKKDIAERLRRKEISNGPVHSIKVLNEDYRPLKEAGRVYFVEVTYNSGVVKRIPVRIFRNAVGYTKDEIAGSWFYAADRTTDVVFEGVGAGHGVGMSQYGAKYLAEGGVKNQKYHFAEILRHYYRSPVLVRVYGEEEGATIASR